MSYYVDSNDGLIRFNAQAEYHNTSLAVLDCSLARKSGAESAQQKYEQTKIFLNHALCKFSYRLQ